MTDWIDTTHRGDCRALLRRMIADGVRVHMCVTSPPYWGLRDYGVAGQFGLERTWLRHVARMRGVFRLVRQVLAEDGVLWMNYGDSYYCPQINGGVGSSSAINGHGSQEAFRDAQRAQRSKLQGSNLSSAHSRAVNRRRGQPGLRAKALIGMPWRVAFALQSDGWLLRSDVIWHKPNAMPESVRDRPTKAHEYLFLFTRSERYYYDAQAAREPASPNSHTDVVQNRNLRTVWTIPTQPFSGAHFATFPEALVARCILAGSRPGDVILDPFMGSGTVAKVARDLGRRFIGCELNPQYIELQMLRRATIGMPI